MALDMLCLSRSLILWGFIFLYYLLIGRKEEGPLERQAAPRVRAQPSSAGVWDHFRINTCCVGWGTDSVL